MLGWPANKDPALRPGFRTGEDSDRFSIGVAAVGLPRADPRQGEEGALPRTADPRRIAVDRERVRGAVLRDERHLHGYVRGDARVTRRDSGARRTEGQLGA